jgi:ribosome-interacting GTPase 1
VCGLRSPPNIYFKKKKTGGVSINSTLPLTRMDEKLIQRVLQEYKIHNCEVRHSGLTACFGCFACWIEEFVLAN